LSDILQRTSFRYPSLGFGSVIHGGAGVWWLTGDSAQVGLAVMEEWKHQFEGDGAAFSKDLTFQLAMGIMDEYVKKAISNGPFQMEQGQWQTVAVEQRLELPLAMKNKEKATLSFQIDRLLYNNTNGHAVIVDTKTAGRLDRRWEAQWERSLQMKLYKAAICRAYDFEPDRVDVVIEGVLKDLPTAIKYLVCPNWSEAMLLEATKQAAMIAQKDHELISANGLPKDLALIEVEALTETETNYGDCFAYNTECPFYKLCLAEPDERVGILHSEYFESTDESY
jgi:hypothetical protein